MLGRINSPAPARSDQLLLGSVPELLLGWIIPEPRSVQSVLELRLGRIILEPSLVQSVSELMLGRIIPEPRSVQSVPELRLGRVNSRIRNPASPFPELRSVGSFPEPLLSQINSRPHPNREPQECILGGRGNDMTNIDMAATSSCPWRTGRHVLAPPDNWPANVADPTRGSRLDAGMEGSAVIRPT
ncbi:hypothetical protein GW17_00051551 [Ensete ventricosum]|nr:hypothetical protein GW17_00051551 [Ensete ventricosum]